MPNYVIAVGVADVRREPDPGSELVTQALMNMPAITGETHNEWTHITLTDYAGWMRTDALEAPIVKGYCKIGEHCGTPLPLMAVITATYAPLYRVSEGGEVVDTIYLSTALPLLDITQRERVQVALPGERSAWLSRGAIDIRGHEQLYPRAPIETILKYARAFSGVPYLWGGTTWQGIDCSGFVQLCYRVGGYILPRDADQQYAFLQHDIERDEIKEGDLVFFGREQITHVAIALGHSEYIHAEGVNYNCVTINSLNPADGHYDKRLDEKFWGVRRMVIVGQTNVPNL